ncbi:hypothetical protein HHI36_024088, partial [Cryptolaemus montrouzieri]
MNLNGTIVSSADDSTLIVEGDSRDETKEKAEEDMRDIVRWMNAKLLIINFDKTKFLPFSCYNCNMPFFKTLDVSEKRKVGQAVTYKCLGIVFDSHL